MIRAPRSKPSNTPSGWPTSWDRTEKPPAGRGHGLRIARRLGSHRLIALLALHDQQPATESGRDGREQTSTGRPSDPDPPRRYGARPGQPGTGRAETVPVDLRIWGHLRALTTSRRMNTIVRVGGRRIIPLTWVRALTRGGVGIGALAPNDPRPATKTGIAPQR